MKIAIIGAGPAGLYTARLLLLQTSLKKSIESITVYEATDRIGGRLFSVQTKDAPKSYINLGAGRYLPHHHKRVAKLVRDLGIPVLENGPTPPPVVLLRDDDDGDWTNDLCAVMDATKSVPKKQLQSVTLLQFAERTIGSDRARRVMAAFGYDGEFTLCNAWDSVRSLEQDLMPPSSSSSSRSKTKSYFTPVKGMQAIADAMYADLLQNHGDVVRFVMNATVSAWTASKENESGRLKYTIRKKSKKITMFADHDVAFFCLTKSQLQGVKGLVAAVPGLERALKCVNACPLIRVYARYASEPSEQSTNWAINNARTTTDTMVRQVIPTGPRHNRLYMACYSDDTWAVKVKNALVQSPLQDDKSKKQKKTDVGPNGFTQTVTGEALADLYGRCGLDPIPPVRWALFRFWKEGVHYWGPMTDDDDARFSNHSNHLQTKESRRVFVAGESVAKEHKCWTEAALMSAEDAVRAFIAGLQYNCRS